MTKNSKKHQTGPNWFRKSSQVVQTGYKRIKSTINDSFNGAGSGSVLFSARSTVHDSACMRLQIMGQLVGLKLVLGLALWVQFDTSLWASAKWVVIKTHLWVVWCHFGPDEMVSFGLFKMTSCSFFQAASKVLEMALFTAGFWSSEAALSFWSFSSLIDWMTMLFS